MIYTPAGGNKMTDLYRERRILIIALLMAVLLSMLAFAGAEDAFAARDVEWGSFQNSEDNNGVTDRETPGSYNEAALKWGLQLVPGYTTSFTPPLIIDGYIYTASSQRVYKINKETGQIVKESKSMAVDVSYAMHPMTYSAEEDALYLPLLYGRVQCIDAETLELRWISKAHDGTQALSPITYKDGKVYTGIWSSELSDGAYFCLDAKTGREVWTLRPSELRNVTNASALGEFPKPAGQDKPSNFYTYTAVITVKAEDGYSFERDRYGRTWLVDTNGSKVIPAGQKEGSGVQCSVNGLTAGIEMAGEGDVETGTEAVIRAKFDYYDGRFEQQGNERDSAVEISGLATPSAGQELDTEASASAHISVRSIEWKEGDAPHGFYWAGCYANDKYVVFGSDDGQNNTFGNAGDSSYTETSILYCCDRLTGRITDRIDGCKGDIRSTVVHHNGYIYFTSKGGVLYKVKLGSDGKFSDLSTFDTGAMMTASPVVHNGRIYVGVCGMAGQFNADGGHKFCVFRDDAKLAGKAIYEDRLVGPNIVKVISGGTGSFIYCVDIAGYPQASPVLSTYSEPSGSVRLYFTFNAFPGGIYYLEDTRNSTADRHNEAELLFRPESQMEQYCISPIAADRQGTLYIKNDSGYMMAVSRNKAWLNDIKVTAGDDEVDWNIDFRPGTLNYTLSAPDGKTSVNYELDVPSGMKASINGREYKGGKVSVPVSEDVSATTVTVTRYEGSQLYTRTYTLNMKTASNNANLAGLVITYSNTAPSNMTDTAQHHTNADGVGFDPVFDPAIEKYVSRSYDGDHEFINVWVTKSDPKATVKVYPVDNVGNDLAYTNEDGTIPVKDMNGKSRYPVYWIKNQISAEIRIEVTSASGKVTKSYNVELVRGKDFLNKGKEPLYVEPATAELYTESGIKTVQCTATYGGADVTDECTWYSSRPTRVTVDKDGVISAQGKEVASDNPVSVWARYGAQSRPVAVTVVKPPCARPETNLEEGVYAGARQIAITSSTPGAKIRYEIGDPTSEAVSKPTDTSRLYNGPVTIGEPGKKREYLIRAAAFNSIEASSLIMDRRFTIDMRSRISGVEVEGLDAPAAGSPLDTSVTARAVGFDDSTSGSGAGQDSGSGSGTGTGSGADLTASVSWYKVSQDGTETPVSGSAAAGTSYRAKIRVAAKDADSAAFADSVSAISGDMTGWMEIPDDKDPSDESVTLVFGSMTGSSVSDMVIAGLDAPSRGSGFDDSAVSCTAGVKVDGVSWKSADGSAVSGDPEYYRTYTAEIRVSAESGYTISGSASAGLVLGGTLQKAEIKKDGTQLVIIAKVKSAKMVLDTREGTGLTLSPAALKDVPNGSTVNEIREKLGACSVIAKAEDGSEVTLGGDLVFWDEDMITGRYDPADLVPVPFGAEGRAAELPEYIDDNGSSLKVSALITVRKGKVAPPVFSPKEGKYKKAQKVTMKSATPGAAVFYTMSGVKGTAAYEEPVAVKGEKGRYVAVTFKAYAMTQGIKSKTVTYTLKIDRSSEVKPAQAKKLKVSGFKVKCASKKFTLSWKKTALAYGYEAQFRLSGAKKWSFLKKGITGTSVRSKALKKGKKYQFRVRTYNVIKGKMHYGKWTSAKTAKCS